MVLVVNAIILFDGICFFDKTGLKKHLKKGMKQKKKTVVMTPHIR